MIGGDRACEELGIEATFWDYDGDDPARYVVSLNVNRRHLTSTERATIALAVLPHYREEAKKRQLAGVTLGPTEPKVVGEPGRALTHAAAGAGVSRVTVQRLQRIERDAPELHRKVIKQEMSIRAADDVLRDRRLGPKRRDIRQPFEISSNQTRLDAEAAKRKLEALLAGLDGYSTGLQGFDTRRAMAAMTPEELQGWIRGLNGAIRTFRALRTVMKAGI